MAALTGDFFQVWWPMGLDFGLPVGGCVNIAAASVQFSPRLVALETLLHFAFFCLFGLYFLSFWFFEPSFPFILAFWVFISFHFGLLGLRFLSFWPFGPLFPFILAFWAFISFHGAFWAFISFHFGLLGLHFLSFLFAGAATWGSPPQVTKNGPFWPFGPSFPFILAFWAFISFHFGLLGFHFLSFWPFGPSFPFILAPYRLHFLSFWSFGPSFLWILALWAFISFHFSLLCLSSFILAFWGFIFFHLDDSASQPVRIGRLCVPS